MTSDTTALARQDGRELAKHEDNLTTVQRLGKLLAASGYFADAREAAQAAVKVMAGEELGIPPIAAMMGISIIKGKVALGANLIASRIRAHGYDYHFKQFDATGCVLIFLSRPEDGKRRVLGESSFTVEDANRAEIKSEMYKKYPRNMFFARAISNGARWYTPEVFAGAPVYTPEELGAVVDEQGDVVQPDPPMTPPEPPQAPTGPRILTFGERVKEFQKQKDRIGSEAYYRFLAAHGFEHSNEIVKRSTDEQRAIYRELAALGDFVAGDAAEPPKEDDF